MTRRWISINSAAEYLALHPVTVRRLIDRGEIPAVRIGRNVRVDLKTLDEKLIDKKNF
jgi:excisionase family DNA binding protein